jgi:hypothetical protein
MCWFLVGSISACEICSPAPQVLHPRCVHSAFPFSFRRICSSNPENIRLCFGKSVPSGTHPQNQDVSPLIYCLLLTLLLSCKITVHQWQARSTVDWNTCAFYLSTCKYLQGIDRRSCEVVIVEGRLWQIIVG